MISLSTEKVRVSTAERIYTGRLIEQNEDGVIIDESSQRVFVLWREILWIGANMHEDEQCARFIKRYKWLNICIIAIIIITGIIIIALRRWFL